MPKKKLAREYQLIRILKAQQWTPDILDEARALLLTLSFNSSVVPKLKSRNENILHFAMQCHNTPLDIIEIILERYPKAARAVTTATAGKRTALHMGMDSAASIEAIRLLVSKYPKAAKMKDSEGRLPLHLGMNAKAPSINLVLDSFPQGVTIQDDHGQTPLHAAFDFPYRDQVISTLGTVRPQALNATADIRFVVEAFPEAVGIQNLEEEQTPLHLAITCAPSALLLTMIQGCPAALDINDKAGRTPLSLGLSGNMPKEVLLAVIRDYPRTTAKTMLSNGWTILHAIVGNASYEVVLPEIIQYCDPMTTNHDGHTPLHLGMANGASTAVIQTLLEHCPEAAPMLDNDNRSALFLGIQNGCSIECIRLVLRAFPGAAACVDFAGDTPLHVCPLREDSADIFSEIQQVCEEAEIMEDGSGLPPLHRFIRDGASSGLIEAFLRSFPGAAKEKDGNENTPLHLVVKMASRASAASSIAIIRLVSHMCPAAAKVKDNHGNTALLALLIQLHGKGDTLDNGLGIYDARFQMAVALCEECPGAAEIENNLGVSAISHLVNVRVGADLCKVTGRRGFKSVDLLIQRLAKGIRDGRPLKKLCDLDNPATLRTFLVLFCNSDEQDETKSVPIIDFNRKTVPGWTFLEILADLDSDHSSEILLQVVQKQRDKVANFDRDSLLSICCKDDNNTVIQFHVESEPLEVTMRKVADRAKLSINSEKLRTWGQVYGRFLGLYRIEKHKQPKHISATCVVVFATEVRKDESGHRCETQVALKFLKSRDAFYREIESRNTIDRYSNEECNSSSSHFVLPILAAYTSLRKKDIASEQLKKMASVRVTYDIQLGEELKSYQHIRLHSGEGAADLQDTTSFSLIVMDSGLGLDLNDVISHQNIAGRDLLMVLSIARCIAECLEYLNERCLIVHGDVKARNFISVGVGARYAAIDLDNAASLEKRDVTRKKRTSSGYMPPEQASVEARLRSKSAGSPLRSNAIVVSELVGLKKEVDKAYQEANYDEQLRLLSAHKEIQGKLDQLDNVASCDSSDAILATPQYDMWCFGMLLYFLCTGEQLFAMDFKEDVKDAELANIKNWDKETMLSKLAPIPKGWPRSLLADLLQPDPLHRPRSWTSVIQKLQNVQVGPAKFRMAATTSPSMWSISYWQLMEVDEVASHKFGSTYADMTMRDINERIIAPQCRAAGSSYALSCNPQGLMIDAFVTHSWDEPFKDFVVSIRKVFQTTVTKPNLWICAFALDQCDEQTVESQLGSGDSPLAESPFVQALEDALTFVVVRNAATDLYSRIWCVCELIYAKKLGLVPSKTHVTGTDVFFHLKTSCLEAQCTNPEDKERILDVLLKEHNAEEINRIVELFRKQEAPE